MAWIHLKLAVIHIDLLILDRVEHQSLWNSLFRRYLTPGCRIINDYIIKLLSTLSILNHFFLWWTCSLVFHLRLNLLWRHNSRQWESCLNFLLIFVFKSLYWLSSLNIDLLCFVVINFLWGWFVNTTYIRLFWAWRLNV